jgi:hypothetical protein
MNQEFLRPRLVGRRFDEHSLPLDILKDFAALEEMLVEVAKRQYLAANPDRVRSPKGFTKGLDLHITAVEPGGAMPVIALVFSTLFPSADADYFEQAKEQIIEAIAAAEQGQPPALPPDLLRYFDRFGRGLREGEAMEFLRRTGQTASLTPATREHLLRASQAEQWTEEVPLKGRIPDVDQADHSFDLDLRDGTLVAIKGVIQRDRADRRKGIEQVRIGRAHYSAGPAGHRNPPRRARPSARRMAGRQRAGHARFACEMGGAARPPAAGTHRSDSGAVQCRA